MGLTIAVRYHFSCQKSFFSHFLEQRSKTTLLFRANFFWLLLLPGSALHFSFRELRGDYTTMNEVGWAPIMILVCIILLLIPLNLFLFFTVIDAKHPTALFPKINKYNSEITTYEVFFGFWLVLNLCCFIWFVKIGDHVAIPVNLFFTYLLLNIRAGKMGKHIDNASQKYNTQAVNIYHS